MTPITADHPSSTGVRAGRSNVKARLTPNRRRRSVENDKYASFIRRVIRAHARRVIRAHARRVIRAHARRVAAGDIDALADMTGLATDLDDAISQAVTGLRQAGYSWAEIASRLGVTRQAGQQRWGRA
ncbi:MAG TPA: hypothetical protein VLW50_05660 [Streptosporangiaceae bacterium]|nr:hypothetical protein [Streptosporangiaceae bacterium]